MRTMDNQVCSSENRHSHGRAPSKHLDAALDKHLMEPRHNNKKYRQRGKKHEHSKSRDNQTSHHTRISNCSKKTFKDPPKPIRQFSLLTLIGKKVGPTCASTFQILCLNLASVKGL